MFEKSLHVPLRAISWDIGEVQAAINEIVNDAQTAFSETGFWRAHPQDEGVTDGDTSIYFGACGVVWALDYLARCGATQHTDNYLSILKDLVEATRRQFAGYEYSAHGSLLFGDFGALLLHMRLQPDTAVADVLYARARANSSLPIRELMWGLPGSMLGCIIMDEITSEARWRELYATQAARLLDDIVETEFGPLWTQDLYGSHRPFLGAVHGYAGNLIPLLRGWNWLEEEQRTRIADAVPRTLSVNAFRSELGAQWHGIAGLPSEPHLCQHCHGAPGMVTTFADTPFSTPEFEDMLIAGGELTWHAGPLAKGSNLCHGTGGNGYAFLKLYQRTHDERWLDRARAFAMTAIAQSRDARAQYGMGRYSLWTGDIGLAIFLWDCITERPRVPIVDVF